VPTKKVKQPLSVTHPELAKEADGWDPSLVTAGSGLRVTWRCQKDHTWESVVYSRAGSTPKNCPVCSNKKILVGYNDILTTHSELAKELQGIDPTTIHAGSSLKLAWECPFGHIYQASPVNRTRGKTGCPVCSGNQILIGFNDLATTHPELAQQAFGWSPESVSRGSTKKRKWKCAAGHTWEISPNARTRKDTGTNCPICSNQKLLVGFNDLKTINPELALQAFNWNPESVIAGTSQKRKWICAKDHIWESSVQSRSKEGIGCPICSNKSVLPGFNDLATTNPVLASQAHGWDPTTVTEGSSKSREWKCELGHLWVAGIGARNGQSAGCPYCSNQKIFVGYNDFQTTHPELAKEADGWDPTKYNAGSLKRVSWICPIGHNYKSIIRDRGRRLTNCPICVGRIVLEGFNDLATLNPILANEANGWDPKTVTASSQKKRSWKCDQDHTWMATVANRNFGRGCPTCAKTGFNPNKEAFLYLLSHSQWEMFQIGITNVPDLRIASHKFLGWELLELRGPMDGHLTQQWETAILRMLKANGADLSNSKIAGKFDGYSEAWSKSTFRVRTIKELMRLTEEFEEKN
jgi:hypothetical protein